MLARPADAAIVLARTMLALTDTIAGNSPDDTYQRTADFGSLLERLFIMLLVIKTTADKNPLNRKQIADRIGIPRTTVCRHLEELVRSGRIIVYNNFHVANLEFYDQSATPPMFAKLVEIFNNASIDLGQLTSLFGPRAARKAIGARSSRPSAGQYG